MISTLTTERVRNTKISKAVEDRIAYMCITEKSVLAPGRKSDNGSKAACLTSVVENGKALHEATVKQECTNR